MGRLARFPEAMQQGIDGDQKVIDIQNRSNKVNFDQLCKNWLDENAHNRDMKLPLTAKPIAPATLVQRYLLVMAPVQPSADDATIAVTPAGPTDAPAGVYVWQENGDPVGVCPDLPPAVVTVKAVPEPAHIVPVPADDPVPTGTITTDAEGNKWQKQRATTPFGTVAWWARVAVLILCIGFAVSLSHAQVRVACSPEPLEVMSSLHVRGMGQWACYLRNEGAAVRTVAPEDVYIGVISIRPIDPASALIVLSDHQARSTAAKVVKVLGVAGQLAGVGLSLASKANAQLGTGLAVGSGFLGPVLQIAQGEVPSTAPFLSQLLSAPVTLTAGGTATRTIFCAKQKAPAPVTVLLQ